MLGGIKEDMSGISTAGWVGLFAAAGIAAYKLIKYWAIDKPQEDVEKAKQKAEESIAEAKQKAKNQSQLDSLVKQYEDIARSGLRDTQTRTKLLDIQKQINDLVGAQAKGLDLVNGKLDTELEKLREIGSKELERSIPIYEDAYRDASEAAEKVSYQNTEWMGAYLEYEKEHNGAQTMNTAVEALKNALTDLKDADGNIVDTSIIVDKLKDFNYNNSQNVLALAKIIAEEKNLHDEDKQAILNALDQIEKGAGEQNVDMHDVTSVLDGYIDMSHEEKVQAIQAAIDYVEQHAKEDGVKYSELPLWNDLTNALKALDGGDGANNKATEAANNLLQRLTEYYVGSGEEISSVDEYFEYKQRLINSVMNNELIQKAIEDGALTEEAIDKFINSYLGAFDKYANFYKEWNLKVKRNEIKDTFGTNLFSDTEHDPTKNEKLTEDFSNWVDSLSSKEIDIVYDLQLKTESAKWSLDDWKRELEKAKQDAGEATNAMSEVFSSKESEDGETFSARIKTYRENIDFLTEALEKYKNGELDEDTFHSLIEKFPQLAGRTKDLDVAITELMDDMDSDMVSDFDNQFGKLETQSDIDALRAYQKELQASTRQSNSFSDAYEAIHSKVEAVMSWAKRWNEITNGNVDYNKRPLVSPEKMKEAFPDFEGEVATTYTQYFSIGEGEAIYTIDITPILEDGTVLNQESLEAYVDKLVTDSGIEGLLASDDLNLVVNVVPGDYDEAYWAEYQSKLDAAKGTHWELIKQLQEETGLAWDEIVKRYGGVIDSAIKFNSKIEETVSAFNTVKSVVNDYNENGFLSLENVQSILSLSDRYILALTNEQGALDLSTESYKKLVEAELLELKAQALQDSIDYVTKIKTEAAALTYLQGAKTDSAQASLDLADAQWKEAMSAAAVKDIKQGTGDLYQRTVMAARKAYEVKVALIDNYAKTALTVGELSTATDDYTKALNNEKDALENSKKALEDQKKALEDTKKGYEDALGAVKDLVGWVQNYIKQIKNDEIDALEKKKETLDDLIDKQKDLLDAEKDEYEWNKKISEKQNTVAKDALAASIASLDDSSAGRKAQKQANDKLAESRTDMHDTLYEHEIEQRKEALDKLKEEQDEYYDNLIKEIQDYLSNEVQLYKDACAMIDNDSGDLYGKLLWYCQNYTTTTEAEFNHMWNAAQSAMQQYNTDNLSTFELLNSLQGRIYEVDEAIDAVARSISSYESAIEGVQSKLEDLSKQAQKTIADVEAAANAEEEWAKPKWVYNWQGNDYKSWKTNRDDAIQDILHQISSQFGGVYPGSATTIYGMIRQYAKGTSSATGGASLVGERGAELRMLNRGDGIVTAGATKGLETLGNAIGSNPLQFIKDAGQMLMKNLFGNGANPSLGAISNNNQIAPNISITVQGDATQTTVKAIEAVANDIINKTTRNIMNAPLKYKRLI